MRTSVEKGFFEPPPGHGWFSVEDAPTTQHRHNALPQIPHCTPDYGLVPTYPGVPQHHPNHQHAPTRQHPVIATPPSSPPPYPGMHLPDHTGTTGLPLGYNFIFPQSLTVLHILKFNRPPWCAPPTSIEMIPCVVPTMITLKELMRSLGCTNKEANKNVMWEVTQGGGGVWRRGMCVKGGDEGVLGMTLGQVGWDERRNGREEDFVWLFLTKD